jgi:hypothetical protein
MAQECSEKGSRRMVAAQVLIPVSGALPLSWAEGDARDGRDAPDSTGYCHEL